MTHEVRDVEEWTKPLPQTDGVSTEYWQAAAEGVGVPYWRPRADR